MSETHPRIKRLENSIERLETDTESVLEERLNRIGDDLERVEPGEPIHPENRTMHDHLSYLKNGLKRDGERILLHEAEKLRERKENLEEGLE